MQSLSVRAGSVSNGKPSLTLPARTVTNQRDLVSRLRRAAGGSIARRAELLAVAERTNRTLPHVLQFGLDRFLLLGSQFQPRIFALDVPLHEFPQRDLARIGLLRTQPLHDVLLQPFPLLRLRPLLE